MIFFIYLSFNQVQTFQTDDYGRVQNTTSAKSIVSLPHSQDLH